MRIRPRWGVIVAVATLAMATWLVCQLAYVARVRQQLQAFEREHDSIDQRLEAIESRMHVYETWPTLQK